MLLSFQIFENFPHFLLLISKLIPLPKDNILCMI